MAESEVLNLLKAIQGEVKEIKTGQSDLTHRLEKLEEAPPSKDSNDNQDIDDPESGNEDEYEDISDDENDYQFNAGFEVQKAGPAISGSLAEAINKSLLCQSDPNELKKIHDNNPIPKNTESIRVPKMNPEISLPADAATSIRDNFIAGIQNNLGTGLAILANMINELKRKTISPLFTSEHQFGKINECMLLLAEAHKQSTLLRRQNVKHLLNDSLHILCSKRAMEKRFSNACVFEEDMGIQADNLFRNNKIMRRKIMKPRPGKAKNGFRQTRGPLRGPRRGGVGMRSRRAGLPRGGSQAARGKPQNHQ